MSDEKTVGPARDGDGAPVCGGRTVSGREDRLEAAINHLGAIIDGCRHDLDSMLAAHPPSKRGSRYRLALASLEMRLAGARQEIDEVTKP